MGRYWQLAFSGGWRYNDAARPWQLHINATQAVGFAWGGMTMRIETTDPAAPKGWYWGPWNTDLAISIGFANTGVDEPHLHRTMTEVYLIARGTAAMRVETETLLLSAGQVVVIEPGEAHTFLDSSADHFHFVIQVPGLQGEEARTDKIPVSRSRLDL